MTRAKLLHKFARQNAKIEYEAPAIEAAHMYASANSCTPPAVEEQIMVEQYLDAIGGMRAAVAIAERELASKRASNVANGLEPDGYDLTKPLIANVAAAEKTLAAGLADFDTKGFGAAADRIASDNGLDTFTAAKLKTIPLASTDTSDPAYTVSSTDAAGVVGVNAAALGEHEAVGQRQQLLAQGECEAVGVR